MAKMHCRFRVMRRSRSVSCRSRNTFPTGPTDRLAFRLTGASRAVAARLGGCSPLHSAAVCPRGHRRPAHACSPKALRSEAPSAAPNASISVHYCAGARRSPTRPRASTSKRRARPAPSSADPFRSRQWARRSRRRPAGCKGPGKARSACTLSSASCARMNHPAAASRPAPTMNRPIATGPVTRSSALPNA
jgi:hypothetical protein